MGPLNICWNVTGPCGISKSKNPGVLPVPQSPNLSHGDNDPHLPGLLGRRNDSTSMSDKSFAKVQLDFLSEFQGRILIGQPGGRLLSLLPVWSRTLNLSGSSPKSTLFELYDLETNDITVLSWSQQGCYKIN